MPGGPRCVDARSGHGGRTGRSHRGTAGTRAPTLAVRHSARLGCAQPTWAVTALRRLPTRRTTRVPAAPTEGRWTASRLGRRALRGTATRLRTADARTATRAGGGGGQAGSRVLRLLRKPCGAGDECLRQDALDDVTTTTTPTTRRGIRPLAAE